MYKYMTTQNNRLTPVLSNNLVQSDGVTKTQKQTIFENMSDGIITVTADGLINYVNSAATQIFDLSEESLVGQSFAETLLSSRKNKAFNRLFQKELPFLQRNGNIHNPRRPKASAHYYQSGQTINRCRF